MISPTFEQQRKFYETYWNDSSRLSIDEKCRKRFVLSALSKFAKDLKKPLRILDIGCGRGWMTDALAPYGKATGVDLSVTEARKRYPRHEFYEMNIVSELPKESYEVVVSSEVIEHLPREHQSEHIQRIASVLSPGGLLILTTPNKRQIEQLSKKLAHDSHMQPIENWLSREELLNMVGPYFSVEWFGSARFYPIFLFSSIFLRAPYHVAYDYLGLYRLIDRIFESTNWGTYFALVGRKK